MHFEGLALAGTTIGISGCGWLICLNNCNARFPPAESPPTMMFAGSMFKS